MLKKYSKISLPLITVLSINLSAYAESIPDAYKFVSQDSYVTVDVKPNPSYWSVFTTNKSLKKLDLFKELNKDNSFISVLFSEKNRKNLGDNLIFSVSNADDKSSDFKPGFLIVEELQNQDQVKSLKADLNTSYSKKNISGVNSNYKDAQIVSYPDRKKAKDSSYFAFVGNYVISSNEMNTLQQSLKNYYNEVPSLAQSDNFIKSFNKIGFDFQGQVHVNMKKIMTALEDSKDFQKNMKTMKLDRLKYINSMALNFNIDPKGIELRTYSVLDKDSKYAELYKDMKKSDFKQFVSYLPKNTLVFVGSSDVKDTGKMFKEYFSEMKELNFEEMLKENLGINPDDLLENMKDEMGVAVFSVESSPIPGFTLFINPKDKEKMISTMNSFKLDLSDMKKGKRSQKKTNPEIMHFTDTSKYKDIDINLTNEIPDLQKMNIRPAYSFIGNTMIFGSNEDVIKSVIDRSKNNATDFTLEGNPSFSRFRTAYGEQNNSIGFVNLATIVNLVSPFMAGDKSLKGTLENLKKFDSIGFASDIDEDNNAFGRFNLAADIENIDFEKLIPADVVKNSNFGKAQERAKESMVKANMHTLQTVVETYAIDNEGSYIDLGLLQKEATAKAYWKPLKNPFTSKTALGSKGSVMTMKDYKAYKGKKADLKGIVVFEALKCSYSNVSKKNSCLSYKIYGLDKNGEMIKNAGKLFYLSND